MKLRRTFLFILIILLSTSIFAQEVKNKVDEIPTPIGGLKGILAKIKYPDIARRAGIQGVVLIYAFVDEQGKVTKVELLKGIGVGCDEEALAAVMETKFNSGKQHGRNVKVQVTVQVKFTIK